MNAVADDDDDDGNDEGIVKTHNGQTGYGVLHLGTTTWWYTGVRI